MQTNNQDQLREYFYQSIDQSINNKNIRSNIAIKSYITNILTNFTNSEQLFSEYQTHNETYFGLEPITFQMYTKKPFQMKNLGDQCLFLVGYFYDHVRKHGKGNVEYHNQVGATAYKSFGNHIPDKSGEIRNLFSNLSNNFEKYAEVISEIQLPQIQEDQLLPIYDKYEQTKDKRYKSILLSKGFVLNFGNIKN